MFEEKQKIRGAWEVEWAVVGVVLFTIIFVFDPCLLLLTGSGCDEGSKPGFSSCCVPKAVRCGTHNRDNCGQCPFDVHPNGFVMVFSHWCNGDCKWQEGNLLSMLWVEMDHPIKFYRKRIRREDLRHFQCRSSILSYR